MMKYYFKNWAVVVFLFISFFFVNFENKALAQVDHTGIIWVVPNRPDAFPVNGTRTGNAGLNLAFEDYHVIEYVFIDSLYVCDMQYKQPIYQIKLQDNYADWEISFIHLLNDCYPGFFEYLDLPYDIRFINDQQEFTYDNGFISLDFYDYYFEPTLLPSSNIRSYNKHMNLILREYDILSYSYSQFVSYTSGDTMWRNIRIIAKYQDILPLYYDLLTISYLYETICVTSFQFFGESSNPCGPYSAISDEVVSSFKIYPNPTQNEIFVLGVIPESVIVYDVMGEMVVTEFDAEKNKIDIKHLPDGLYILKIISKDGKMYSDKIFKQ